MVISPNTFYYPNNDDFNQEEDQCLLQYPHGHHQYNPHWDVQFHNLLGYVLITWGLFFNQGLDFATVILFCFNMKY